MNSKIRSGRSSRRYRVVAGGILALALLSAMVGTPGAGLALAAPATEQTTTTIGTDDTWQVDGQAAALVPPTCSPNVWLPAGTLAPAQWVWITPCTQGYTADPGHVFEKHFTLSGTVASAQLDFAVDNYATISINGQAVPVPTPCNAYNGDFSCFGQKHTLDVASFLVAGNNVIDITASNAAGGCWSEPGWAGSCNPAGLVALMTITTNVDTVPPDITITTPADGATYILGQPIAADYSCSDATSGPPSCDGTVVNGANIDTATVGSKSFVVTSTDLAGNNATATVHYKVGYRFVGFLQPINDTSRPDVCGSPCMPSIFKGGSTVPVKFQLLDYAGNGVQASTLPTWLAPMQLGPTTAAVDESVVTTTPTTDNTYRWDSTAQQYIYNWSTKGIATGYYWRIGALVDGAKYTVDVGLR